VKKAEDIDYVILEIDKTADRFKAQAVSEKELENIKMRTRYDYLMGLDTPGRVAGGLARLIALTGGIEAVDELYNTLATLTPEDIRVAANRYLQNERRTVLILKGEK
jgi:predicted Zn-dependent peptidase